MYQKFEHIFNKYKMKITDSDQNGLRLRKTLPHIKHTINYITLNF